MHAKGFPGPARQENAGRSSRAAVHRTSKPSGPSLWGVKARRFLRSVGGQFLLATLAVLLLFLLVGAGVSYLLGSVFGGGWFVF